MNRVSVLSSLLVLVHLCPVPAVAYPETHPPFPFKTRIPYRSLTDHPVIDYDCPATFSDGILRIVVSPANHHTSSTVTVEIGQRKIFERAGEHPAGVFFPFGSRVFYSDLTGDGRKDILILSYPGGVGFAAWIELADLLIAQAGGTYKHIGFETFAAGPEDFIDVDGDGRYEMLWEGYYFVGDHSYWVYRVVEIGDDSLRIDDQLIPGFPKIIWFTEKPNDKPTQKLTAAEREDLIRQSTDKWNEAYDGIKSATH